jgi:exosortase family protein XrtF
MPLKEGIFRYLLSILLGYVGWLILYEFFILPKSLLDEFVIDALVRVSEQLLNFLGFNVTSNHGFWANTISLDYFPGVWVSPNCDGLSVVAIFIIVVMSFPGEMKKRLYFISIGVILIEIVNMLRIVSLSLIHRYHPQYLKFNHDYTFTVLVYAFVIFLWWWWFSWNDRSFSK